MSLHICTEDGCERTFDTLQGLNVHRTRTHGVDWLSADEAGPTSDPITRLLSEAFPMGVPVERLDEVVAWREATVRLLGLDGARV